jgi:tetratricopeptide (TPR) repeat protein
VQRAITAAQGGEPAAAVTALESALRFEPSLESLHLAAARLALDAADPARAQVHLDAVADHPSDPALFHCLSGLAHTSPSVQPQRGESSEIGCMDGRAALRAEVSAALGRGDIAAAVSLLRSWLIRQPDDTESWEDLAGLETARNLADGKAVASTALARRPGGSPVLDGLLGIARRTEEADGAARAAADVGRLFASNGRWEIAAASWSLALSAKDDFPQARAYLGLALNRLGEDGRPEIERAAAEAPQDPLVQALVGQFWLDSQDVPRAIRALERAHSLDSTNPALLASLAEARARVGDYGGAADALTEAAQRAPQQAGFWLLLAGFSLGNDYQVPSLGIPAARNAAVLEADDPEALSDLGFGWHVAGEPLLAERFLARSIRQDPSRADTWYRYGIMLLDDGQPSEAADAFRSAIRLSQSERVRQLAERALESAEAGRP